LTGKGTVDCSRRPLLCGVSELGRLLIKQSGSSLSCKEQKVTLKEIYNFCSGTAPCVSLMS